MEKNIDAIYDYTKSILTTNIDSRQKLDTKFNAFIGFTVLFIRLSFDIPEEYKYTRLAITLVSFLIVIICSFGLFAKLKGKVGSARELLQKECINKPNIEHQVIICKERVKAIQEYQSFLSAQVWKINLIIWLFVLDIIIYLSALAGLEKYLKNI